MPAIPVEGILIPAGAVLAAASIGVVAYGTFAPRSTLFGPVISRARPTVRSAVALTFDDGPAPDSTDAILDILRREKVFATFFVIGRYAAQHPTLLRRVHDEGHLIGNHTFDHSRLGMFSGRRYWVDQVRRTNDLVRELTGQTPALFRPPMGFKCPPVMYGASANECRVVTWTRRAFDGVQASPRSIIQNLTGAESGEILLLHDGRDPASRRRLGATADALPGVIANLRARAIEMLRLDELLVASSDQPSRAG
jgi:peptidoglycan-N-acetylglucosamine deacetylase